MSDQEVLFISTDQLPDDPMTMPPPFWRGSGASFHIEDALKNLIPLLKKLMVALEKADTKFDRFFEQHSDLDDMPEELFANIYEGVWLLEHKIHLKTEIAVLMSAIEIEDRINRFCVYNLHKDVSETIEQLSVTEKLLLLTTITANKSIKGNSIYEALKKISSWRNAFVHGHCVDRPTKTLRHNHLIAPENYPSPPTVIKLTLELVEGFLKVDDYLSQISINPYTKMKDVDDAKIRKHLQDIARFKFTMVAENPIYLMEYR
jgi:uncharacterized protein YdcH (DUF465 family)